MRKSSEAQDGIGYFLIFSIPNRAYPAPIIRSSRVRLAATFAHSNDKAFDVCRIMF